ncbi:MAG TPA: peptidase M20, partial [Candidatus Bathyarchaeia archaeon]|nr:peptidase M20 [Candidatus Bathyarchaeia archaeon]
KAVIKSAEMAHGRKPKVKPISAASGPTYIFARHLKMPTVSTGAQTTTKRNHAPNEYVEIKDYLAAIKKLAAILYNYRNED